MKMRLAGEAGLPRKANRLPGSDFVAELHHGAVLLQMDVFRKCAVSVFDDDEIRERPEASIRAPDVRILFHADHAPVSRGTDDRAFRDGPVDRVLAAGAGEMTE